MSTTVTFSNIKCTVNKQEYVRSQQIALQLTASENQIVELEGMEPYDVYQGEPVCTATIAAPNAKLADDETVIKTFESPEILKVLLEAGIVKNTGNSVQIGFTNCPVVQVTM